MGNQDAHNGIWYNLESYFVHNLSAYSNRVSLSMSVSLDDIDDINTLVSSNDTWSLTNNCSSFATKIWNQISSTDVSAGVINTPTSLMNSIKSKTGYQTNRSIGNTTPIGYVGNNGFVSVSMSTTRSLYENVIPNTEEENAIIITPININPNSME